ncbi:MAG TPA: hypothetical protein VJN92_14840 [Candidatus Acidoferrum sp.]|nr:hypothetical protein [Candidatus Acidoferrum sp.]
MVYPRTATCLLALLATPPIVSSQAMVPNATTTHCRVVQFGDFGQVDDAFIVIRGVLGPSSFFKNLRCVDSAGNTVFMNETGEALTFPDRLTITLVIMGPVPKNEFAQPKRLDSKYMLGLCFSANWKRGVKMRPVKAFRELTASESQPRDLAVSLNVRQSWIYEFVVEDTDVPLTDHLILCVFSPENKRLARLSAHF